MKQPNAVNLASANLVMGTVNLFWILCLIKAAFGLPFVIILSGVLAYLLNHVETQRKVKQALGQQETGFTPPSSVPPP